MAHEQPSKNTDFEQIAAGVRKALGKTLAFISIAAAIEGYILFVRGSFTAMPFLLITLSSIGALAIWVRHGRGLPIVALLAAENLAIYALPIVVGNEGVLKYGGDMLTKAAWEVAISNTAMIIAWRVSMTAIRPSTRLCYALLGFNSASGKLTQLGLALLVSGSTYTLLSSLQLTDVILGMLPAGTHSIVHALVSAVSACGFFLCGMMIGRRQASPLQAGVFWTLLAAQCIISAAGLLLSASLMIVFASIVGLFWGSGRIPWRYITITVAAVAFLNLGKFTMRDKYWDPLEGSMRDPTLAEIPSVYREWSAASFDALVGNPLQTRKGSFEALTLAHDTEAADGQSLLHRINNLENLLFAIDAIETRHIPPLAGATYTMIPSLLVPRILWPEKPRTHQGQVLLNVHFGRQDMSSTFKTYIAWGLLPEAYGNYGAITGSIVLGVVLGLLSAIIEQYVRRKLVLSLEGFLSFTLFLGMACSFEMVASVLVTSIFQGFVPVILACAPFVARILPNDLHNGAAPPTESG